MIAPPFPTNEDERLDALKALHVLDTEPDPAMDSLVRAARSIACCRTALISLIDANRQWFKARDGLDAIETPRDVSFCGWAILDDGPLLIENALDDERFADNPLVTEAPGIRSYAGFPIHDEAGYALGTLCAFDPNPGRLNDAQIEQLTELANVAGKLLTQQRANERLSRAVKEIEELVALVPICSHCRCVREDDAYLRTAEHWITEKLGGRLTHGLCPRCAKEHHPDIDFSATFTD